MAKNRVEEEDSVQVAWNILGGERSAHGEITISKKPERSWREEHGVIYFTVTPDNTTGEEWITRLESKGFRLTDSAKRVLRSLDFKSTNRGTIEIAILKGMLFEDNNRTMEKIRAEADKRGFVAPEAEVACLICEKFTDEEIKAMGLWWIATMHEPIIKDSGGGSFLLDTDWCGDGRWFRLFYTYPGDILSREDGFAFEVSQVV